MLTQRKKKDFKIREDIVLEFERLAPSGKQTAIVERLLAEWIAEQKRSARAVGVKRAYEREKKLRRAA